MEADVVDQGSVGRATCIVAALFPTKELVMPTPRGRDIQPTHVYVGGCELIPERRTLSSTVLGSLKVVVGSPLAVAAFVLSSVGVGYGIFSRSELAGVYVIALGIAWLAFCVMAATIGVLGHALVTTHAFVLTGGAIAKVVPPFAPWTSAVAVLLVDTTDDRFATGVTVLMIQDNDGLRPFGTGRVVAQKAKSVQVVVDHLVCDAETWHQFLNANQDLLKSLILQPQGPTDLLDYLTAEAKKASGRIDTGGVSEGGPDDEKVSSPPGSGGDR